ncbi:MAG TPA: hypothetical protein VHB50_01705 [Bryobacteraceae bacterium]|nr:hypothetical protein [Bryobacteraceae bacterium]
MFIFAGMERPHFTDSELSRFYRKWVEDPDSVGDDEFDTIHLHLLVCEACCARARKQEQRSRVVAAVREFFASLVRRLLQAVRLA